MYGITTKYKGPGCYRFLDILENTIYVGSSKNIDRRLKSHFNGKQGHLGNEVYSKVARVEILRCEDYPSALAMEQVLISKYRPRYNKKDKSTNINYMPTKNTEEYEKLEKWQLYYKLKSLDKDKIDTNKRQDRILLLITYAMLILIIIRWLV